MVVVRVAPGKGKGLYAKSDIPSKTLVAKMRDSATMKRSEVENYKKSNPKLPHDFVIYKPRSSLVFYDKSWDGTQRRVPLWYRMNHSSNPNCAPIILNPNDPPRDQEIGWVTMRSVRVGDELTYAYDNVPDEWI